MVEVCRATMANPRVVVIAFPGQGHVNPLMHMCKSLAEHGIKTTVVNTELIHTQLVESMGDKKETILGSQIELIAVPDGFPLDGNRDNIEKVFVDMTNNLQAEFEKLLNEMNSDTAGGGIACVIVDISLAWVLKIAERLGIRGAAFSPHTPTFSLVYMNINKLIQDGIIDSEGAPITDEEMIQVSPGTPSMRIRDLPWLSASTRKSQKILFDHLVHCKRGCEYAKWCLLNGPPVVEPEVAKNPWFLPLGPLMATEAGQFWKEDHSCLHWLDQQPLSSVVFMAFGSTANLNVIQFQEMAMGLELSGRPFLWVVRPGTEHELPANFKGTKGKIIAWAPQQKVLSHPSVGCFLTHCGWNSILEGMSNGLPFLCWPCVGDQFLNKSYVTDVCKIGIEFDRDENGIASRWEIKKKLEQLLSDESFRVRSAALQEEIRNCIKPGGHSSTNLHRLVRWINEGDH